MITVSDLDLAYSGQPLFSHVDLQFTKGKEAPTARANPPS